MTTQLTQFVIGDGSRSVDVDLKANTLYIGVDGQKLLALPSDIDWLIEALTKAKKLIEGEQA